MSDIHLIPLDAIDEAALTRDRAALDEAALTELRLSIAVSGLRMPIEVFELAEPSGPHRYGLISGIMYQTHQPGASAASWDFSRRSDVSRGAVP